jgi:hypothetical protein
MITLNVQIDDLVDELLNILDEDSSQVKVTLERLNRLRAAVIKRDEEDIKALLDTVMEDEPCYSRVETRRQEIRKELAEILGCTFEQMNLTYLCSKLPEEKSIMIADKQHELRGLTEKLRIEHMCTSMLLKECARLNKMLLKSIFSESKESVTYNSVGNPSWEMRKGLVNFRL